MLSRRCGSACWAMSIECRLSFWCLGWRKVILTGHSTAVKSLGTLRLRTESLITCFLSYTIFALALYILCHPLNISDISGRVFQTSGPSCSKLTMSLVNDSLKFTSSHTQICWNFLLKICECKSYSHFSAKNIRILCIESAKTVNEMTLNELVNDALNNWALVALKIVYCLSRCYRSYAVPQSTLLYMKRPNKTMSQIFFLLCVICFQRQPFRSLLTFHSGPSCSKLTVSLVNDSLKF